MRTRNGIENVKYNLEMTDRKEVKLRVGSIVNIHQTVNGRNLFVVLNLEELDVRYAHDLTYKYEYDMRELLDLDEDYKEIEIVGNIYDYLDNVA